MPNSTGSNDSKYAKDHHPVMDSEDYKQLFVKYTRNVIRFGPKCSDLNRQYERENNKEQDNGVIHATVLK
jgi:hypothetical protein